MKLSRRELRRLIESVINEGVVSDVVVSALSAFGIDERDIERMSNHRIAKEIYEKSIADPGKFNNFYDDAIEQVNKYLDEPSDISNFPVSPVLMISFLNMADSLFRGEPISEQTDSTVMKYMLKAFEFPLDIYNYVFGAGFGHSVDDKVGLELLYTDEGEEFIVKGLTTVLNLLLGDDSDRKPYMPLEDEDIMKHTLDRVDDRLPPDMDMDDMDMDTGMDMDFPSRRERQYR